VELPLALPVMMAGIRTAAKPADEDHAWGHAKAENISSLIQMFLLGATCIAIVIESVRRLVVPGTVRVGWYSFVVVLAAMVIDIVVSRYLQSVSRAHGGSAALDADALHFASDLWASLAVLVGITLVAVFNFQIADPLAGIAVAIIIGTTAIEQGRRTTQVLLDAMPDRPTLAAIERILESDPRLHGYHPLRARPCTAPCAARPRPCHRVRAKKEGPANGSLCRRTGNRAGYALVAGLTPGLSLKNCLFSSI